MTKQTPEEFFNEIHRYAALPKGADYTIALGLSEGNGWLGDLMAVDGNYISPNGSLADDYHEFCRTNGLDQHEVNNAERFLKQFKLQQKMSKISEDFE